MRGGKRQGAGRKALHRTNTVTIRLTDESITKLRWACKKLGCSQSDFIERQIKGI